MTVLRTILAGWIAGSRRRTYAPRACLRVARRCEGLPADGASVFNGKAVGREQAALSAHTSVGCCFSVYGEFSFSQLQVLFSLAPFPVSSRAFFFHFICVAHVSPENKTCFMTRSVCDETAKVPRHAARWKYSDSSKIYSSHAWQFSLAESFSQRKSQRTQQIQLCLHFIQFNVM